MGRLAAAAGERGQAQSALVVEDLGKSMADVGIDMARMQRDPAYAQHMQERLRKLSPAEAMALSQRMSQPLNQDKRYRNPAQAMAEDSPAIKAAADAGLAYSQAQPARIKAHEVIWREAEEAVERVRRKPLNIAAAKPAMDWENIGCEAPCRAQWEVYAGKALPLMIERDTEILKLRRAAVQRQRAALAEGIKVADGHLVAARYGAAPRSQVHQMNIAGYDGAAVGELKALIDRITDSARSAAAVVHCGKQAVLVPGAVCQ
jgi:hypothetical protein